MHKGTIHDEDDNSSSDSSFEYKPTLPTFPLFKNNVTPYKNTKTEYDDFFETFYAWSQTGWLQNDKPKKVQNQRFAIYFKPYKNKDEDCDDDDDSDDDCFIHTNNSPLKNELYYFDTRFQTFVPLMLIHDSNPYVSKNGTNMFFNPLSQTFVNVDYMFDYETEEHEALCTIEKNNCCKYYKTKEMFYKLELLLLVFPSIYIPNVEDAKMRHLPWEIRVHAWRIDKWEKASKIVHDNEQVTETDEITQTLDDLWLSPLEQEFNEKQNTDSDLFWYFSDITDAYEYEQYKKYFSR